MIGWMQKNNKYLVPTIWIATIAFIGAGAVGWGSMNFGDKASSVAKVGDIAISKNKYIFTYNNIYAEYAQKFGNKFDKEMAKKLGLQKQVLNSLISQAYLLNLAKEYGIIATDEEIAKEIANLGIFKDKNGVFQKSYYENFLRSRGLKPKDFEVIVRDDLVVKKLMALLDKKAVKFEKEVIGSSFLIADKIKYAILKAKDINVSLNDDEIKKHWEKNKFNYLTPTKYKLELLVTKTDDINVTDAELEKYYKENSFDFIDKEGKTLPLAEVKDKVIQAVKLKKAKKEAIIARSRFKKGKIKPTKVVEIAENSKELSPKLWESIKNAKVGDFIKPKPVGDTLVTAHLLEIKKPEPKSFEAAKEEVTKELKALKVKDELEKQADKIAKDESKLTLEPKDYISFLNTNALPELNFQQGQVVVRSIFGNNKEIGKVNLDDSVVVYKITQQKMLEDNGTIKRFSKEIDLLKSSEFNQNLLTNLAKKYKVQKF